MRKSLTVLSGALAALTALCLNTSTHAATANVNAKRLVAAETSATDAGNWLSTGRTYSEQRFSPLENAGEIFAIRKLSSE